MSSTLTSYTEALNSLAFSDEAKARMKARLAAARDEGAAGDDAPASAPAALAFVPAAPASKARARKRPVALKVAATAAGIVLALGAGGYGVAAAAGILPAPSEVLSDVFGDGPAQTRIIDKVGHPLNASATSNGMTVTARAVIGDANGFAVVFDVSFDDGWPFDPQDVKFGVNDKLMLAWNEGGPDLTVDGATAMTGGSYFYDADPSDNTIQYVVNYDQVKLILGGSIAGRTARVSLTELDRFTEDGRIETVVTGNWDLKFELNYEDTTVSVPAGQTTTLAGHEVTVSAIGVSDTGVTLDYDVIGYDVEGADSYKLFELPVTVTFADGSEESFTSGGGSTSKHDDVDSVSWSHTFDHIHDAGDVVSITIGDVTVPVNE
ncbi:MAG: DUF4179 domain-containing protein [Coriobacteriia bacterium]|nr:DUF4179 domain-containing protein [Coriobacteriia bacterium]